ncbi:hypothetical protein [Endozoicomonas euniceicola]|uniref:Uncharacterized protein n=1 Tax=Endozoicomonas euniceicola TaxID=1234143 RepID=A0ABY6H0C1_9GAMM|nr:hypothetical protein [Endozoicomonas euniceicola]UYM17683.1 hypothetical protein NX720_07190 [Endozoicomonas euniceicola]
MGAGETGGERTQDATGHSAVTALLPLVVQVVEQSSREVVEEMSPEAGFNSQGVTNLLWALAKLVENGLEMQQAHKAMTALLPQVVEVAEKKSPEAGFSSQAVSNLLWALAKLVENGLEMPQANRAVTALLLQVVQMSEGTSLRAGFVVTFLQTTKHKLKVVYF